MRLYLAGNFVVMGSKDKEKQLIHLLTPHYHRLFAFYYEDEANNVVSLKEEMKNEQGRTVKRIKRRKTRNSK